MRAVRRRVIDGTMADSLFGPACNREDASVVVEEIVVREVEHSESDRE